MPIKKKKKKKVRSGQVRSGQVRSGQEDWDAVQNMMEEIMKQKEEE
jgi:hypothetical protein